ncbi:D-alanyl-D-alanine carboxypeptidase [Patescibacteria group bacterium]|nr:D-alanyl-D-alanine carboxypeptidase [Patescibacteria group bacterium]
MKDFLKFKWLRKNFVFVSFLTLFLVLLSLMSFDLYLIHAEGSKKILPPPSFSQEISAYPVLKSFFVPQISARGAIVMDADSKIVIYAKNPHLRFSSASTTKIMTALTALDIFKLNESLTIKTATVEGSIINLKKDEKFTLESLLYAILLPSANDAALAIAENHPQGKAAFVKQMNENAKKWNLANTRFEDPAGLDDNGYTTPFDLARLASIAVKNKTIAKIVSEKTKTIFTEDFSDSYFFENRNKLLGVRGIDGVKTGFTEEAGEVLVTSRFESTIENPKQKHKLITVVMGSSDRFLDTFILTDLISGNVNYLTIRP